MTLHFLLADEDGARVTELARSLRTLGVRTSTTRSDLLGAIASKRPDACIVDALFPGITETVSELGGRDEAPPLVVLATTGQEAEALEAVRHGAASVLSSPTSREALETCLVGVERALTEARNRARVRESLRRESQVLWLGSSPGARRLQELIERVAGTPGTTVLVTGELGTPKDLVAMALHERSARPSATFVRVDCRRDRSIETTLFGGDESPPAFVDASRGTLFLESIDGLELGTQERLARLLSERTWEPPGGGPRAELDSRIVATTERDLERLVAEGRFREDLLYRLNVLTIEVPPLRERREDIRALASHACKELPERVDRGLTEAALAALEGAEWRGNDRELFRTVERALLAGTEPEVGPAELCLGETDRGAVDGGYVLPIGDRSVRSVEEALIRRVLRDEEGNRSKVARVLGINRTTLYNKLRQFGID